MAATTTKLCYIKIVLLKNNDAYEKEFIIDNMSHILLENFMKDPIASDISRSKLLMIRENAYIDSDVLQQIKSLTSKSQNNKYKFMEFSVKNELDIKNEFYEIIGNFSDVEIRNNTLKFILKIALDFLNNDQVQTSIQSKVSSHNQAALRSERDNEKTKVTNFITRIDSDANEETFYDDVIKDLYRLLTSKPLMSEIKNKYNIINKDKTKDEPNAIFRTNLSNIMLNKSTDLDDTIKFHAHEKYEYFLNQKYLDYIFTAISDNTSKAVNTDINYGSIYRTPTLFNTKEKRMQIIKENIKYVFPNKTNVELLDDNEEQTVLLFHNILYIIKKIYLVDTTIIEASDTDSDNPKKFYVKNLKLVENNPFIRSTGPSGSLIVTIKFTADITYINQNPILKINYILDNKEIIDTVTPLKLFDFEPNNFLTNPSSNNYKSIYIYDTIDYISYDAKIKRLLNTIKIQKIIKNKEEIFFNETALNEFNDLLDIKFNDTDEKFKDRNIPLNIIYFLKNTLKLYNGKEIKHNTETFFVYDTLIADKLPNAANNANTANTAKFYSIAQNKVIDYKNIKSEKIIKLFKKRKELLILAAADAPAAPAAPAAPVALDASNQYITDKFDVYKIIPKDRRIEDTKTYLIFVVFLCYKADEQGKKPSMNKRLVAEVCLERARTLDRAFNDLFYTKLNIPETYLFTKLLNLNKSKKAIPDILDKKNDKKIETNIETNIDKIDKMKKTDIDLEDKKIIGGKKKYTLKIKHKHK